MNKSFENQDSVITGATNKIDFVGLGEMGLHSFKFTKVRFPRIGL
jgi:hypothetical protein